MALPLVVMLIVGMVSAGIAFNHQLALTHAAREGGRYAATLPVESLIPPPGETHLETWLKAVIDRTVADATGSLNPGAAGRSVCVAYVSPGTTTNDQTAHLTLDSSGYGSVTTGTDCFGNGPPPPTADRRVQVVVMRDTRFNALVFSTDLTLEESAENRYEAGVGL